MSAGTMIALSAKEIMMGKHSNLGPIDPQMGGVACQAILDEFQQAKNDIKANPHSAALWQVIISRYHPTFLGACKQAIEWSRQMVSDWLSANMCESDHNKVQEIMKVFADHKRQKSHARHISRSECEQVGLCVVSLEADQALQDAVLTTHHAFMHTFSVTNAVKLIENHLGIAYIESSQPMPPHHPM
jgi:membrane-bound ClpP family serine protease